MRFGKVVVLLLLLAPTVGCSQRFDPFDVTVDWADRSRNQREPFETVADSTLEEKRFQDLDKAPETVAGAVLGKPPSLPGLLDDLQLRIRQMSDKAELLKQHSGTTGQAPLPSIANATTRDLAELDAAVATLEKILRELTADFAALKEREFAHSRVVEERLAELAEMIRALERRLDGDMTFAQVIPASAKTVPTPVSTPVPAPSPAPVPMVFTNYSVSFACGAQKNVPLAPGGGWVQCPLHRNHVWVSVP